MTKQDFEKLRGIELEILEQFIKVCEELDLRYYCIYGTALGAIRHKGYIPWDDDIDIGMPRKDYDIFMEKAQAVLPEEYFVQSYEWEKDYLNPFGKLRKSNTTFIEKASKNAKMNHGIYIDIFPLDGYPQGKVSQFLFKLKRLIYDTYIFEGRDEEVEQSVGGAKGLIVKVGRAIVGNISPWEAVRRKDKLVRKVDFDTAAVAGCLVGDYPSKEVMEQKYFGKGTEVPFEHISVRVPDQWDQYLTHTYGDYMTPPPEEERYPLHTCEIIDFDRPYTEYL